jgi:hypothetical protein
VPLAPERASVYARAERTRPRVRRRSLKVDIGRPKRIIEVEPIELPLPTLEPLPETAPAPETQPAEPQR